MDLNKRAVRLAAIYVRTLVSRPGLTSDGWDSGVGCTLEWCFGMGPCMVPLCVSRLGPLESAGTSELGAHSPGAMRWDRAWSHFV